MRKANLYVPIKAIWEYGKNVTEEISASNLSELRRYCFLFSAIFVMSESDFTEIL